jgi:hypothetical protein
MNPKVFFNRLKTLLQALTWPTTANKVFGNNVFVVPYLFPSNMPVMASSTCFIEEVGFINHEEEPSIVMSRFSIVYFIENVSNQSGEGVVIDANRIVNTSRGVGYLELERLIQKNVINTVKMTDNIYIRELTGLKALQVPSNNPNMFRSNVFEAMLYLGDI